MYRQASNILLDRGAVLLADLGIAASQERRLSHDCPVREFGRYLQRRSYVGSPVWMAPEVMEQQGGYAAFVSHCRTGLLRSRESLWGSNRV